MRPAIDTERETCGRRLIATFAAATAAVVLLVAAPSASALGFQGLATTPGTTQAGANTNFTINIGFSAPGDDVHDLRIGLPPGQIGNPTVTPLCTVAEFNGAGCNANTQVGSVVTNIAALGFLPLAVNGVLYNLVPNPGEPARFGIHLSPTGGLLPLGDIKLQSAVELAHSRRKLGATAVNEGAARIAVKLARGALLRVGVINGKKKLKLPVTLIDTDGIRTVLKVKVRPGR